MTEKHSIESLPGEIFAKDGLQWILAGGKIWRASAISAVVVFCLLTIVVLVEHRSLSQFAVIKLLHTSMIIFILVTFSSLLCALGMYPFLKPNQRYIDWSFSSDGFVLKDKAGNQIVTPWTQVKAVKFHSKSVSIYCKPFGSRWVPNRFLPDGKLDELQNLVKAVGVRV